MMSAEFAEGWQRRTSVQSKGSMGFRTSEFSGVDPQTLRLYERRRLLTPTRTCGGTRRYSEADLNTLRRITALVDEGVSAVGVRLILSIEAENDCTRSVSLSSVGRGTPRCELHPRREQLGRIPRQ
jgi:MerR family transcriptional regulator/heat shock protein HspR